MPQKIAIYPGSFDPFTNGHVDILKRALKIFDRVIVAVSTGALKNPLFTLEERLAMIRKIIAGWKSAEADHFDGLVVNYARKRKAVALVRGLRAVSDFEYEFQMALMNRRISMDGF